MYVVLCMQEVTRAPAHACRPASEYGPGGVKISEAGQLKEAERDQAERARAAPPEWAQEEEVCARQLIYCPRRLASRLGTRSLSDLLSARLPAGAQTAG